MADPVGAGSPQLQTAGGPVIQPALDLFAGGLIPTHHFDQTVRVLADRPYSRRTPGAAQFAYSGRKMVLRSAEGDVGWVWSYPRPELRMDGQEGYCCALFRNESPRLSSSIILEAEDWAVWKWGPGRMFTYVRPDKVASPNPGFCFIAAGWHSHGWSAHGLRLLVKFDNCPRDKRRIKPCPTSTASSG
jgi:hypothetical protein